MKPHHKFVFIVIMFLLGCLPFVCQPSNKPDHSQIKEKNTDTNNNSYKSRLDWILDRDHLLDYRVGIDTLFFCDNGRFQIIHDSFVDNASGIYGETLMTNILSYWTSTNTVYLLNETRFGILGNDRIFFSWPLEQLPYEHQWIVDSMIDAVQVFQQAEAMTWYTPQKKRQSANCNRLPMKNEGGICVIPICCKPLSLDQREEIMKARIEAINSGGELNWRGPNSE
ncbi:MAG: hypothetical protein J6Y19_07720 [Kiritimatiellae bacterium]|nr:hypothetical protein [Kiritimatiellia bacterium]